MKLETFLGSEAKAKMTVLLPKDLFKDLEGNAVWELYWELREDEMNISFEDRWERPLEILKGIQLTDAHHRGGSTDSYTHSSTRLGMGLYVTFEGLIEWQKHKELIRHVKKLVADAIDSKVASVA